MSSGPKKFSLNTQNNTWRTITLEHFEQFDKYHCVCNMHKNLSKFTLMLLHACNGHDLSTSSWVFLEQTRILGRF